MSCSTLLHGTPRLLLVITPCLLAACGEQGTYELHWTIGCATPGDATCQLKSVMECSRVGLDAVAATVLAGDRPRSLFPCFAPDQGAIGRGPGLEAGEVTLEVSGLAPNGVALVGPVTATVRIPDVGFEVVSVNLPRPPACADGVDNDGDGLVDLHDPDCKDPSGTTE